MYISANIAETIKIVAKSKGIQIKDMLSDLGLGLNTLQNMKTSMLKADSLAKIADYLGVSVDFLLGRKSCASELTENEAAIVAVFKNLTETQQGELIGRAKLMAEQNAAEQAAYVASENAS